ncbi:MAG: hypothetical protein AAF602_27060 [Myxococcota bacterium]
MAGWRDWSDPDDPSIEWAPFFSPAELEHFQLAVEADLTRRGLSFRLHDGLVWVDTEDDGESEERFGLKNLAQLCHQSHLAEFAEIIAGHFDALFAGRSDRELMDSWNADLDEALPNLKLRIYPSTTLADARDNLIVREVAPDLLAVLCFDLPRIVATVPASSLDAWGVTLDDLWSSAVDNVRRDPDLERTDQVLPDDIIVSALIGDSLFTASQLLCLEGWVEPVTLFGAIVAVPHRHALLYHPIVGPEVVDAVARMAPMAIEMHAQGPGSITPELFWWRPGQIDALPTDYDDGQLQFMPPSTFLSVLEQLIRPN